MARVIEIGADAIDRLHFDEAWYAYARFNPLYRNRHAMFGDRRRLQERPDVVRDALDAQAARGALAGVVHSHSRRPGSDRACALQRVVHDACFDLAVLSDHRVERDLRRDDGRRERRCVDDRGDPRGGELSTDDRPHQAAVRGGRRLVLRHVERERGHRSRDEAARGVRRRARRRC